MKGQAQTLVSGAFGTNLASGAVPRGKYEESFSLFSRLCEHEPSLLPARDQSNGNKLGKKSDNFNSETAHLDQRSYLQEEPNHGVLGEHGWIKEPDVSTFLVCILI